MVNRDISADDIGQAFRNDKIKILIKSEADEADLFGDANVNSFNTKLSMNNTFSKPFIRKAN